MDKEEDENNQATWIRERNGCFSFKDIYGRVRGYAVSPDFWRVASCFDTRPYNVRNEGNTKTKRNFFTIVECLAPLCGRYFTFNEHAGQCGSTNMSSWWNHWYKQQYSQELCLNHYQLDYWTMAGLVPWNWSDGARQSVMYGLYYQISFGWFLSFQRTTIWSKATLDFISQRLKRLVRTYKTISYTEWLFQFGFLCRLPSSFFILIVGICCLYRTGETRKRPKLWLCVKFYYWCLFYQLPLCVCSRLYCENQWSFSKRCEHCQFEYWDRLSLPIRIIQEQRTVWSMIRDSLFSVQVKQPWLLLQYGSTDTRNLRWRPCGYWLPVQIQTMVKIEKM